MPIDIEVKADAGSLRSAGGWLRGTGESVHGCGTQIHGARTSSGFGWEGDAGDGFRAVASGFGARVDELGADLGGTGGALDVHADDIDTVRARMDQAAAVAREGGLTVTATQIADPGPPPPPVQELPTDRPPTPQQAQAHAAGTATMNAYVAKVAAAQQAGQIVSEGRGIEVASQRKLLEFLEGQAKKSPLTIGDFATGLAGERAGRTSRFRGDARRFSAKMAHAGRVADNMFGRNQQSFIRAAIIEARAKADLVEANKSALDTRLARMVDRLPDGVRRELTRTLDIGGRIHAGTPLIGRAAPLLKRIPVVNLGFAGFGIAYDIKYENKHPVHAAASNLSGLATGVAVGAAIGGPVGVVIGGVVGIGVGYVVDEWGDDIARGAGDLAEGAADVAGDVGGWFKDRFS